MKATRILFFALATVAIAGCSPYNRRPPVNSDAQPVATRQTGEITDIPADELMPTEAREESAVDQKVGEWITTGKIPEEAILSTIYFGFDKFDIAADQRAMLDAIASAVNKDGIYIIGYSDYIGTEEYNTALSDKRAQSVKKYLNNLGSANSAQVKGMGEQFAAKNGTKDEIKKDRKVIIVDGNAAK